MAEATPETDPPKLSWSDIPLDLAGLVLRRLPAHVDRVRFAAVCPQWRSAARQGPLPPPLPLLALPDGTVYSLPRSEPFRLPACAGYADACGGNWLFFSGEDGCFLRDPLSNATVTLPAMSRVRLHYADDEARSSAGMDSYIEKDLYMCKVLFCSPHLIAALVRVRHVPRIALCKPGAASWWSVTMDSQPAHFSDIAFHQGNLYAFDYIRSDLYTIDICVDNNTDHPCISRMRRVIKGTSIIAATFVEDFVVINTVYLVESHGALLMVKRGMYGIVVDSVFPNDDNCTIYPNGRNDFEVFQADFERSTWTEQATIDLDRVLFLGRRCSRFIPVSHEEILGGCIVFFENDDDDDDDDTVWYNIES